MKKLSVILASLVLSSVAFCQTLANGASISAIGNTETVIFDLTGGANGGYGINAISPQSITLTSGAQLLNTNFKMNKGTASDTLSIVNSVTSGEPNGNNALQFTHLTSEGTTGFGNYIYPDPSTTNNYWIYNQWAGQTLQYMYWVKVNSATRTYYNASGGQIKILLQRCGNPPTYSQDNTTCGTQTDPNIGAGMGTSWNMDGFGNGFGAATGLVVQDDSTTGRVFQSSGASNDITTGVVVKCIQWRDTINHLGHVHCSVNGTEVINTDTKLGCNTGTYPGVCTGGGEITLGLDNGNPYGWDFTIGMRYTQASTGTDTTATMWLSRLKACVSTGLANTTPGKCLEGVYP